jgi:hypothetical protein
VGSGHITVPQSELISATCAALPRSRSLLEDNVGGLSVRDLDLDHERVWDARLMARLLDPNQNDDHEYRSSALVREYLNRDYPYMGEDLFAHSYPKFLHH